MDEYDKEILANILTAVGLFLMVLVIIVNFISWDFSWFSFRMFTIGVILYLIAHYILKTIEE